MFVLMDFRANRRSWWTTKDRDIVDKYQVYCGLLVLFFFSIPPIHGEYSLQDLLGPEASQQSNVFLMLALSTILKRDPQVRGSSCTRIFCVCVCVRVRA
jgi:hypothetical protein